MASNKIVIDLCDDSEDEKPTSISFSKPSTSSMEQSLCQRRSYNSNGNTRIINDNKSITRCTKAPIDLEDFEDMTESTMDSQPEGNNITTTLTTRRPMIASSGKVSKRRKINSDNHKNVVILLDDDDEADEADEDSDDDDILRFSSGIRRQQHSPRRISKHEEEQKKPKTVNNTEDLRKKPPAKADANVSMKSRSRAANEVIELDDCSETGNCTTTANSATRHRSSSISRKTPPESSGGTPGSALKNPYAPAPSRVSESPPIVNPYQRTNQRQLPPARAEQAEPSDTSLQVYPKLLDKSKMYPDQRARFLRAFWNYGRKNCTRRSFERPKLDIIVKRMIKLALAEYPLRSVEEMVAASSSHKAVSALKTECNQIQQELQEGGLDNIDTPYRPNYTGRRTFCSIVEASLVAFMNHVNEKLLGDENLEIELKGKEMWISLEDMIPNVDRLLMTGVPKLGRNKEPDNGASYLTQPSTRSLEFLQIAKLETEICGGPFLKRHMLRKTVHYELLPAGYKAAKRIDSRSFPAAPGHYRCSKLVHKAYESICIGVDHREGGGGKKVLHTMCNKLEMQKIPYFVGCLSIGDYVFFSRDKDGSMDLLCPIFVERKSVQDLAGSINDGRWSSQKRRMYAAQHVFGYEKSRMVYIIEGNINKQTVSGDYIGARWLNVDIERVNGEIENLQSEGFEVLRTTSPENSMFELARLARRVSKDVREGTMELKFTYQSFKKEIAKIPDQIDFSRIAKYHAEQRLEETNRASTSRDSERSGSTTKEAAKPKSVNMQNPEDEYVTWKKSELEAECFSLGLPKSGCRSELIKRLRGPRPPKVWLERKRLKQYVPASYNVGGTALLVALYLHEEEHGTAGMTKDELYVKAEGLNITKNPFSGGTTQTGPYHYDGWANMAYLLRGDPALVDCSKRKYRLTRSCSIAGYPLAKALHLWCHEQGNCSCSSM